MPPRMHKSHRFDIKNPKIFWGGGKAASPDPTPSGEGDTPSPHPTHSAPSAPRFSRLRRLDSRALGARSRSRRLRRLVSQPPPHWKFLATPLVTSSLLETSEVLTIQSFCKQSYTEHMQAQYSFQNERKSFLLLKKSQYHIVNHSVVNKHMHQLKIWLTRR